MRYHNHSIFRFLIDTLLVLLLLFMISSPVIFLISLKITNLNLKASLIEAVAGAKTEK